MNVKVSLSVKLASDKNAEEFVDRLEELCKQFAKEGRDYYFEFRGE